MDLISILLKDHWRLMAEAAALAVIALLSAACLTLHDAGIRTEARYEAAQEMARQVVDAARHRSQKALEKVNANHEQRMLEAKSNAEANMREAIRKLSAARRAGAADRVLPNPAAAGTGSNESSGQADAGQSDPVADFAYGLTNQCAETTVLFNEWQQLCRDNPMICEVVE